MAERPGRDRETPAAVVGRSRLLAADLPSVLTTFVGRDGELAAVSARLADPSTRLVTLLGPGGVGKTRLALRLASDMADGFTDGVAFVSLATTRSAARVPDVVRLALGLVSDTDRTPTEQVLAVLRDRRLLLVFDGFERLMAAAQFVSQLVDGCPGIVCLVTSRRRLRLTAERVHQVVGLALPDPGAPLADALASEAVRLFIDRAGAGRHMLAPASSDLPLIGDICRRLDGLPLAIELTAARTRLQSLVDIASMLERHVPIHTEGPTDAPDRHRSLRASVAWSYDLLAPDSQRLLRWLSVFDGSASLAAVESLATDLPGSASALEMMGDIVELSLMGRASTIGPSRYVMLETVREVMLESLDLAGESDRARTAHARYCHGLAKAGDAGVRRAADQRAWFVELELEQPNLRAAIDWYLATGQPDEAAWIAFWLARFWIIAGHLRDARDAYHRVTRADGLSGARRTDCLGAAALIAWSASDMVAASALHTEMVESIGGVTEPASQAHAAWVGAIVLGTLRRPDEARDLAKRARALWADLGDIWHQAAADWALGVIEMFDGDPIAAEAMHRQALATIESAPDDLGAAVVRTELGIMMLAQGDARGSLAQAQRALTESFANRAWTPVTLAIDTIAAARAGIGDVTAAIRLLGAADHLYDQTGSARKPPLAWMTEPIRAVALAELGAPAADAAMRAGRDLPEDDAIAEALAPADRADTRASKPMRRLAPRELEALALVADGRSDQQIAETLHISAKTASKYVAAAIEKLGTSNRAGAAAIALRGGLI